MRSEAAPGTMPLHCATFSMVRGSAMPSGIAPDNVLPNGRESGRAAPPPLEAVKLSPGWDEAAVPGGDQGPGGLNGSSG